MVQIGYVKNSCFYPLEYAARHFHFAQMERTWKGLTVHIILGISELAIPFSYIIAEIDRIWHTKRFFRPVSPPSPPPVYFPAELQRALREIGYLKQDLDPGAYPGGEMCAKMGIHTVDDLRTLGIFDFSDRLQEISRKVAGLEEAIRNAHQSLQVLPEVPQDGDLRAYNWAIQGALSTHIARFVELQISCPGLQELSEEIARPSRDRTAQLTRFREILGQISVEAYAQRLIVDLRPHLPAFFAGMSEYQRGLHPEWNRFEAELGNPRIAFLAELEAADKTRQVYFIYKYLYQKGNTEAWTRLSEVCGAATLSELWEQRGLVNIDDKASLFRLASLIPAEAR